MALITQCDACGTPSESTEKIGMVLSRDYCPTCAPLIRQFQQMRDELHTNIAHSWTEGLEHIAELFHKRFPGGQMPDQT